MKRDRRKGALVPSEVDGAEQEFRRFGNEVVRSESMGSRSRVAALPTFPCLQGGLLVRKSYPPTEGRAVPGGMASAENATVSPPQPGSFYPLPDGAKRSASDIPESGCDFPCVGSQLSPMCYLETVGWDRNGGHPDTWQFARADAKRCRRALHSGDYSDAHVPSSGAGRVAETSGSANATSCSILDAPALGDVPQSVSQYVKLARSISRVANLGARVMPGHGSSGTPTGQSHSRLLDDPRKSSCERQQGLHESSHTPPCDTACWLEVSLFLQAVLAQQKRRRQKTKRRKSQIRLVSDLLNQCLSDVEPASWESNETSSKVSAVGPTDCIYKAAATPFKQKTRPYGIGTASSVTTTASSPSLHNAGSLYISSSHSGRASSSNGVDHSLPFPVDGGHVYDSVSAYECPSGGGGGGVASIRSRRRSEKQNGSPYSFASTGGPAVSKSLRSRGVAPRSQVGETTVPSASAPRQNPRCRRSTDPRQEEPQTYLSESNERWFCSCAPSSSGCSRAVPSVDCCSSTEQKGYSDAGEGREEQDRRRFSVMSKLEKPCQSTAVDGAVGGLQIADLETCSWIVLAAICLERQLHDRIEELFSQALCAGRRGNCKDPPAASCSLLLELGCSTSSLQNKFCLHRLPQVVSLRGSHYFSRTHRQQQEKAKAHYLHSNGCSKTGRAAAECAASERSSASLPMPVLGQRLRSLLGGKTAAFGGTSAASATAARQPSFPSTTSSKETRIPRLVNRSSRNVNNSNDNSSAVRTIPSETSFVTAFSHSSREQSCAHKLSSRAIVQRSAHRTLGKTVGVGGTCPLLESKTSVTTPSVSNGPCSPSCVAYEMDEAWYEENPWAVVAKVRRFLLYCFCAWSWFSDDAITTGHAVDVLGHSWLTSFVLLKRKLTALSATISHTSLPSTFPAAAAAAAAARRGFEESVTQQRRFCTTRATSNNAIRPAGVNLQQVPTVTTTCGIIQGTWGSKMRCAAAGRQVLNYLGLNSATAEASGGATCGDSGGDRLGKDTIRGSRTATSSIAIDSQELQDYEFHSKQLNALKATNVSLADFERDIFIVMAVFSFQLPLDSDALREMSEKLHYHMKQENCCLCSDRF